MAWIYKETLEWQLNKHIKTPEDYTNIFPQKEWTLIEYQTLFHFIDKGWLVQSDDTNGFKVNEQWQGEALWSEVEEELKYCDDCEGECKSNETEKCDNCSVECRNGCANNPSDESIFNYLCDKCRDDEDSDDELKVKVLSLEEAIRLRKNGAELTKIDLGFETE